MNGLLEPPSSKKTMNYESKKSLSLKPADLENKEQEGIKSLLSYSFEYLLAGVLNEYCIIHKIADNQRFNEINTLPKPVILAYPFFVAVSNGHSESLYSLFGEFQISQFGPKSISISKLISIAEIDIETFQYFEICSTGIKVKSPIIHDSFLSIQRDVRSKEIPGLNIRFSDIFIKRDSGDEYSLLHKAIDNGISIINKQSNNTFFDGNIKTITFQSSYFSIMENRLGKIQDKVTMNFDEIDPPVRRPFYLEL